MNNNSTPIFKFVECASPDCHNQINFTKFKSGDYGHLSPYMIDSHKVTPPAGTKASYIDCCSTYTRMNKESYEINGSFDCAKFYAGNEHKGPQCAFRRIFKEEITGNLFCISCFDQLKPKVNQIKQDILKLIVNHNGRHYCSGDDDCSPTNFGEFLNCAQCGKQDVDEGVCIQCQDRMLSSEMNSGREPWVKLDNQRCHHACSCIREGEDGSEFRRMYLKQFESKNQDSGYFYNPSQIECLPWTPPPSPAPRSPPSIKKAIRKSKREASRARHNYNLRSNKNKINKKLQF